MAIINPINKGIYAPFNDMVMWRKYDSSQGFKTRFKVNEENDTLDIENNIEVPYIEYFKNSNGEVVEALTRYKKYYVINYSTVYWQIGEQITPHTYYNEGDVMPEHVVALGGEIIPNTNPVEYYIEGQLMVAGTIAIGGEIKVGTGVEVKQTACEMANNWFTTLARTPITAPYGVMDSIEATLTALPQDIPDGYKLPRNCQ